LVAVDAWRIAKLAWQTIDNKTSGSSHDFIA
jgi:hypothetical protein